jgi:hypothetical protein
MTKLNLSSVDGLFVSYDLSNIREIRNGKAKDFYSKADCEDNGIKVNDSIIVIRFNDGNKTSFASKWTVTFA